MAPRKPKTAPKEEVLEVEEIEVPEVPEVPEVEDSVTTEPEERDPLEVSTDEVPSMGTPEPVPAVEEILTPAYLRTFNEYLWIRGYKGKVEEISSLSDNFKVTVYYDKTEEVAFEGETPKFKTPEELMEFVDAQMS